MTRLLLCACLLSLAPPSLAEAGGINLSWNDCGLAGVRNQNFLCNTNAGVPFVLFASFDPNADMADCVSNKWLIDLQSAGATLPPWWSLRGSDDPTGRCRDASLVLNTNFAAGPFACADPWGGAILEQGSSYTIGFSGANTARITGAQSLNVLAPTAVSAGTEYYSFALIINRTKTVGTDSCAGCSEPVCFVLQEIAVIGLSSIQRLTNPRDRNFVIWQREDFALRCCPPDCVPTLNRTWGQVKSIYR